MTLQPEVIAKFITKNKKSNLEFLNRLNERMITILKKELSVEAQTDIGIVLSPNDLKRILNSPEYEHKVYKSLQKALEGIDISDKKEVAIALTKRLVPVYTNMYFYGMYKIVKNYKTLLTDDTAKKITSKKFYEKTKDKIEKQVLSLSKKLNPEIVNQIRENIYFVFDENIKNLNESNNINSMLYIIKSLGVFILLLYDFIGHCTLTTIYYMLLRLAIGRHNKKYNVSYIGIFFFRPSEYKKLFEMLKDPDISIIRKIFIVLFTFVYVFIVFKLLKFNFKIFRKAGEINKEIRPYVDKFIDFINNIE